MILEKLAKYYDALSESNPPFVAPIGYSSAKVGFEILLSEEGEIQKILDLRQDSGKKLVPVEKFVPLQKRRSSNIEPYFLCDKSKYVFGFESSREQSKAMPGDGETERQSSVYPDHFKAFKELHERLLGQVDDAEAKAVLAFLHAWTPESAAEHPEIAGRENDISGAPSFAFALEGSGSYVHENPKIRDIWGNVFSNDASEYSSQCLITGEVAPIANVHQAIKGVVGAQSSGAAIVSFNIPSFRSYGKEQSYNAPVSRTAMLKYTASLNYLLSGKNNIRIGDTTIVYWAERLAPREENFLLSMLNPKITASGDKTDNDVDTVVVTKGETEREISGVLEAAKSGRRVIDPLQQLSLDPDLTFYILGLAPNASRLSIRFWLVNSFGELIEKISKHYSDMDIEKPPRAFEYTPTWALLEEIAAPGKNKKIPNSLISSLNYSIFNGTEYPYAMLSAMSGRIRADKKINYQRAGFIKAFLNRRNSNQNQKEVFAVSLNPENTNPAYLLGRLFSLLEKVQLESADGKLNSTIKDR
ncbi:MAG: type I-C CRISPR-associated protein Cas8c/Csd1, partial [Synergistaceae bacterium]|nr:type I-C CRISPR-associated protein Cas8c/Csd1 [Synergistaceae bacterium]